MILSLKIINCIHKRCRNRRQFWWRKWNGGSV
jgi:hypothetical protein